MPRTMGQFFSESNFAGMAPVSRVNIAEATRFNELLSDTNMGRFRFGAAMEEAVTTSDFPSLLGFVFQQTLLPAYSALPNDVFTYISRGTNVSFLPEQLRRIWGLRTPLSPIGQLAEYPEAKMADGGLAIQVTKYGKQFGVSWETLVNDRLGAFTSAAQDLAQAAVNSEYRYATALFATPTGPNPALYGSAVVSPFETTIAQGFTQITVNNLVNVPFSREAMIAAIQSMQVQVGPDGEPMFFDQFHLVYPPALDGRVREALSPSPLLMNGGTSKVIQTSTNILPSYGVTPHMNPYLPILDKSGNGAYTWYIFASPKSSIPAVQFNFLAGHETPEVFRRTSDSVAVAGGGGDLGEVFENDGIWWKVRHCFGGTTMEPRSTYASVASS